METSASYINHIDIVKELNLYNNISESRRTYEKSFEEIYQKAKDENIKLDSAQDFINNLSKDEIRTLQKYDGLVDSINAESLSAEGAYNLLVHDYEEYDFNNDGHVEVGVAKMISTVPRNMDDDTKKAWVETINAMGNDMISVLSMTMSLYLDEYMMRDIALHLSQMTESQIATMQESASFNIKQFIEENLSKTIVPKLITFQDIIDKVDGKLENEDGYTSPQLLKSLEHFKEEFLKAYSEVQAEKKGKVTTEQEIEIKQKATENITKKVDSVLTIALS